MVLKKLEIFNNDFSGMGVKKTACFSEVFTLIYIMISPLCKGIN